MARIENMMMEQDRHTVHSLDAVRRVVLSEEHLQDLLRATTNEDEFIAAFVHIGADHGYAITPDKVREALRASRRAWFERWIPQ